MTDLLARTADLVAIPSESHAEAAIADHVVERLGGLTHLTVERVGDNVVARTQLGRSSRLVVAGHLDTVPANGNADPRVEGEVLWGLGSADMKGGLAVMLELAAAVPDPAIDVSWVFYVAEEVAAEHNGLGHLFAQRPDLVAGDAALLGEPTDAALEVGCQGSMRLDVTMLGARAHTARPWMGRNALHRAGQLLAALGEYDERRPVIDGCEFREALQAVFVEGGVAGNVVPDRAVITLNHRFAPDRTADEARAHVEEVVGPYLDEGDTFADDRRGGRRSAEPRPSAARGVEDTPQPHGAGQARMDRRQPLRRRRHPCGQLRPGRLHVGAYPGRACRAPVPRRRAQRPRRPSHPRGLTQRVDRPGRPRPTCDA